MLALSQASICLCLTSFLFRLLFRSIWNVYEFIIVPFSSIVKI
nr:MAG TPA: hypothetical protein [Caudoviricetes sp.]